MFFFTLNYEDFFFPNSEGNWKKKFSPQFSREKPQPFWSDAGSRNTRTQSQINLNTLGVHSGKCQRGELVYLLWNVPIQIFFHNFRGLKWIPLQKRMAPKFKTTTLAHSSLLLSGCPFPIFSYFFSLFLFSPIFKLKPPIFPIFQLVKPKFVTKLKMELQLYVFLSEICHKASSMQTLMF